MVIPGESSYFIANGTILNKVTGFASTFSKVVHASLLPYQNDSFPRKPVQSSLTI